MFGRKNFVYEAVLLLFGSKFALSYISESPHSTVAFVGEHAEFRCTTTFGYIYWFVNQSSIYELPLAVRKSISATYNQVNDHEAGEMSILTIFASERVNNSQVVCADDYRYSPPALLLIQGNLTVPVNFTAVFNDAEMTVDLNWRPPFVLSIDSMSHNFEVFSHFIVSIKTDSLMENCNSSDQQLLSSSCRSRITDEIETNKTEYQYSLLENNISMCGLKQFEFAVSVVSRIDIQSELSDPAHVEIDEEENLMCTKNNRSSDVAMSITTESEFNGGRSSAHILVIVLVSTFGTFILVVPAFISGVIIKKCCYKEKRAHTSMEMTENECYVRIRRNKIKATKYSATGSISDSETRIPASTLSGVYEDPDSFLVRNETNYPGPPLHSDDIGVTIDEEDRSMVQHNNKQYLDKQEFVSCIRESSSSPRHSTFRVFDHDCTSPMNCPAHVYVHVRDDDTSTEQGVKTSGAFEAMETNARRNVECDSGDVNVSASVQDSIVTIPSELYAIVHGIEEHSVSVHVAPVEATQP